MSRTRTTFANPFFVLLLVVSTLFVISALAYLVSPAVTSRPESAPGSRSLAGWLDRRGPLLLGGEFAVMLAAGVLAMATDHRFDPKRARPADHGPHP
jgi:hypothetical protein